MQLTEVDSQIQGALTCVGSDTIIDVFDQIFERSEATVLRGGADEPFYDPDDGGLAVIHFRHDYVRSALHEVSHWCLAGPSRRSIPDYGYWYTPDNRDERRQAAFYQVEVRPQALESVFCDSLGIGFRVSLDNLEMTFQDREAHVFNQQVQLMKTKLLEQGLPRRAEQFHRALQALASSQMTEDESVPSLAADLV